MVLEKPHGAAVPLILYQIVTVPSSIVGGMGVVMVPLMVVFSPIVIFVGEAMIEIVAPLFFPVLTWAAINVKTSM